MENSVNNPKHECIIGLLSRREYCILVTLPMLKKFIADDAELIEWAKNDPDYMLMRDVLPMGYTLSDYADKRRSTGLQHFRVCPECGTAIDWNGIRHNK